MKKILSLVTLAILTISFTSCQEDYVSDLNLDLEVSIQSFSVNGIEGIIDEANRTIKVVVPDGTDLSKISPSFNLPEGAVMTPDLTGVTDFTEPVDVMITNGVIFSKYTITVTEQYFIAFLGEPSDFAGIVEDDQRAAGEWFFNTYDNAEYISFSDIKDQSIDLERYRLIWWYYDGGELPEIALDPIVKESINTYYKGGRNLLFNGHANAYFWELGRLDPANANYERVFGNGDGFENGDTWSIGVSIGAHDQSNHPLYKGVSFNQDNDGYKWVPIIGPGFREDHNYTLINIPPVYGLGNADEAAYQEFRSRHDAEWLGVWGGIRDYWMVGVIELKPNDVYSGKAIYQGIGGFEFNQNAKGDINPDGVNAFQDNIEQITKNAISYLSLKN
ncbi:MAG: DUF4960 domain-containing protein [Flavobacteriaceae bacterium]|jgi:hypothetical protein